MSVDKPGTGMAFTKARMNYY